MTSTESFLSYPVLLGSGGQLINWNLNKREFCQSIYEPFLSSYLPLSGLTVVVLCETLMAGLREGRVKNYHLKVVKRESIVFPIPKNLIIPKRAPKEGFFKGSAIWGKFINNPGCFFRSAYLMDSVQNWFPLPSKKGNSVRFCSTDICGWIWPPHHGHSNFGCRPNWQHILKYDS